MGTGYMLSKGSHPVRDSISKEFACSPFHFFASGSWQDREGNRSTMMALNAASKVRPFVRKVDLTGQVSRSMTVLSKQSSEEYKKLNYTARMKKTGRPVSPHVTIYAFPIAAIASITNRVTGVALSFGAMGLGGVELMGGPGSALSLMEAVASYGPLVAASGKFAVTFPCLYHFLGTIRHFAWDERPDTLTIADVEKSSYYLIGTSLMISGGLIFM
mmetsp:Transcript_29880/g.68942  ORF Transcript_29880/g.68942 Transcript_29880/m.68942 type:complete len:216 (-) Transcript_29880:1686-2333(-)